MNVMLRTLGIPSRQMSGFGEGVFDEKTHQYTVNSLDAHSLVEVCVPCYGWTPFEPTPDGLNVPVNRPATKEALNAPQSASAQPSARIPPGLREPSDPSAASNPTAPFADIWRPVLTVGAGLLILALIALLLALRWLMAVPDGPRIWRRPLFLGYPLKRPRHTRDSPPEFCGPL